jgi:hypothetical protein
VNTNAHGDWDGSKLFASLVGVTLTAIDGMKDGSTEVMFTASDGRAFRMYHEQDCCESVALEDVAGEPDDLIGVPLLMAEVVVSEALPAHVAEQREKERAEYEAGGRCYYGPDSETWTYYKFATAKGYVTLRWLGVSNGYYSESVTFEEVKRYAAIVEAEE